MPAPARLPPAVSYPWRSCGSAYLQAKCNVTVDKISITEADATISVIANGLVADDENNITVDDQIKKLISIIDTAYTCY